MNFEVRAMNCGIVEMIRGSLRVLLWSLQDDFDISFSHGLTQIMHEETTEP